MYYIEINNPKEVKLYKEPIPDIILFKTKPSITKLKKALVKYLTINKCLQKDDITWAKGYIIEGKYEIHQVARVYNVVKYLHNWDVLYLKDKVNPDHINTNIDIYAHLYLDIMV